MKNDPLAPTVLVVDDEETERCSLADILRLESYQVTAAASGEAAVAALRQQKEADRLPFDVMLLDLKMPGMDGLSVLRIASQEAPETQVILLTAHGSLESAIEALRRGASDYLLKPTSPGQIVQSVGRALQRRRDLLRQRDLLGQLETSLFQLKSVSGGAGDSAASQLKADRRPAAPQLPYEPQSAPRLPLGAGVTLDPARRELHSEADPMLIVSLTPSEAKFLQVIVEHRPQVLSHQALVEKVQGYEVADWEAPEVLRPLVSRLRHKLAHFPGGARWIISIRGTGYAFEGPPADLSTTGV
jgi:DNA-binding response OmpR family regulator